VFEDTEDATEDPEPIMVTQGEKDDTVEAILDKHIGVGAIGWHRSMEQRCACHGLLANSSLPESRRSFSMHSGRDLT